MNRKKMKLKSFFIISMNDNNGMVTVMMTTEKQVKVRIIESVRLKGKYVCDEYLK